MTNKVYSTGTIHIITLEKLESKRRFYPVQPQSESNPNLIPDANTSV